MPKSKTVLAISQKGEVGKTTIIGEVAFECEHRDVLFEFYDLDIQGGTIHKTSKNSDALVTLVDSSEGIFPNSPKLIELADIVIFTAQAAIWNHFCEWRV